MTENNIGSLIVVLLLKFITTLDLACLKLHIKNVLNMS